MSARSCWTRAGGAPAGPTAEHTRPAPAPPRADRRGALARPATAVEPWAAGDADREPRFVAGQESIGHPPDELAGALPWAAERWRAATCSRWARSEATVAKVKPSWSRWAARSPEGVWMPAATPAAAAAS